MNEQQLLDRESLKIIVFRIREYCAGEEKSKSGILTILSRRDEYDKTNVFDFVDDEWFDLMYGKIELIMGSSWYAGDGSYEHRVAEVMVAINVGHILRNGNKRSATLVLLVLCVWNNASLACSEDEIHDLALEVAQGGNDKKEESVVRVREFLKKNTHYSSKSGVRVEDTSLE